MASFTGANPTRLSAATLTDPKALKKHLANGIPIPSHFETSSLSSRRGSEPPHSESSFYIHFLPDIAPLQSKDDAYHILENKGKKTTSAQNATMAGQAASSTFDPRRLLDPKGFSNEQRQRDSKSVSTQSSSCGPTPSNPPSNPQLNSKPSVSNGGLSEINVNGLHKRDREDYEGPGLGSLIERVHNVSQREERPQKKPKIQRDNLDVEKGETVKFVGGGNGGEIGDYLKEKRKQGIAESGPVNAVVDLTGGTYRLSKHSTLGHRY